MEDKKKRARSANFTSHEKEVLLSIISKFKNVVENKKTDGVSCEEKAAAWKKISSEFNALSPNLCERSCESLKKFFDNKKKEVRKQVAEEKKEILLTGGGTIRKIEKDPNQEIILSVMNEKTIYGTDNPFDSDNVSLHSDLRECDDIVLELSQGGTENENNVEQVDRNNSDTSGILKRREQIQRSSDTPKTKKSCRRRPATTVKALSSSTIADKYNALLDKRLTIADYETKKLQNDINFNNEEHKLKLNLLQLDIQLKKEKLKSLSQ